MSFRIYLSDRYTQATTKSYLHAIDHFLFYSDSKGKSSYADIVAYLAEHDKSSPVVISGIKRYFDYLIDSGVRHDHPCRLLTIKRPKPAIQFQELFTPEELQSLLSRKARYSALADRDKSILSLLIYQGLTPANICNLTIQNLNLEKGTIYIKATPTLSRRTLEIKAHQIILLHRYIQESRTRLSKSSDGALFISKLGRPFSVDALNRMIRPLQRLFPTKNLNANTIRKSVISNWLNVEKIPLEDVQLLSGQKWLSSTERYIQADSEANREKINRYFPL